MTVEELLLSVIKDRDFYNSSGGGITITGGEPLMQPRFLLNFLKMCKEEGINTAIETSGYASWKTFSDVLNYVDLLIYDVKLMDAKKHLSLIGGSLDLILENLLKSNEKGVEIWVHTPLIPGYTDEEENIIKIARFVSDLENVTRYGLIPYNPPDVKYKMLGRTYELSGLRPISLDRLRKLLSIAKYHLPERISVEIG
jgi:pyruvate formate lyase activating enzyme